MVRQNLLLTLDFLIRIFKPSDEVVFFQSEEIQFARVNHYRKQHFNRSNRSDKLGMSFGKAISKFFDRNMTDEIFSLIKELRPSFDDLTISYNSSNIKGDASFKINKFMYGNPDCTAVVYSSDTEMINYSVIRPECTFIIFDHVLLEKERVFVNLSTINCSLLRKQVASDWFCVENWFLMVQLLGNSFLPGLLKAPDKPLSIRHLFTMHRTLAGSKAVLVNENGEIDVEETSVYVSHFTPSRQNSAFGELLGQYRYNLNEYLRRAIHPGHKIKNWFILPDPVPLTLSHLVHCGEKADHEQSLPFEWNVFTTEKELLVLCYDELLETNSISEKLKRSLQNDDQLRTVIEKTELNKLDIEFLLDYLK